MTGLYLFITLIAQLSPAGLLAALEPNAADVSVQFAETAGVNVGSPVLLDGRIVGFVDRVMASDSVKIKIAAHESETLKEGAVALLTSPLSRFQTEPSRIVEFFSAKSGLVLDRSQPITGYSSFQDFWSDSSQG